ncbi:hypothetical protein BZA03_1194 [Alteromonas sp. I10]|nr:hypothetical protein BZA03_1194 [Alteromonas sp. I10]
MATNKALNSFPSVTGTQTRGGFAIFAACLCPLALRYVLLAKVS